MNKVESFQTRLKQALYIRNMRASELCRKTNISKSLMSQYINGVCEAKQDNLFLIANVLYVDYGWLMGYDVPMQPEDRYHRELRDTIKEKLLNCTDEQLEKILDYTNLLTK